MLGGVLGPELRRLEGPEPEAVAARSAVADARGCDPRRQRHQSAGRRDNEQSPTHPHDRHPWKIALPGALG